MVSNEHIQNPSSKNQHKETLKKTEECIAASGQYDAHQFTFLPFWQFVLSNLPEQYL